MNSHTPLVSILAICYNHERFVEETLNSITNQTYKNIELVIIDDFSTDNSVKVISNWIKNNNIVCQFVTHQKNKKLCETLNEGVKLCKGEFLQFMACDDILVLDKIENQLNTFKSLDESYCLVYSDVIIIDDNSVRKDKTLYQRNPFFIAPQGNVYHSQAESQFIKGVTCLYRLETIIKIGMFDEELYFEDVDLFLRLAENYKFCYYNTPTALWREHDNNMTKALFSRNNYLITRFLAYRKHIFKGNSKISYVLLKKMDTIFLILYKNKFSFTFDSKYLNHLKINNNLLHFCYRKNIAYRWYLIAYETKSFFRKLFKYLFSKSQNLPPTEL